MKSCCVIFAGGPEVGEPCLPVPEDAYIICADSGLRRAEQFGLMPDLVLGDFDSLGAVPQNLPHMTVPVEKDDTDTMLAARVALEKGYRDIRIYGAFGGRLDHTLANIQTLAFLTANGAEAILVGARDIVRMQTGGTVRQYPRREDFTFSVFAYSAECTGVTLRGVYYPLNGHTLRQDFPLGVSNRITEDFAEVSAETGTLLVVSSRE